MEEIVEANLTCEQDVFFLCKICPKKFFTKIVFKIHLKNKHSPTLKTKAAEEPNKDPPIAQPDCNSFVKTEVTSNMSVDLILIPFYSEFI